MITRDRQVRDATDLYALVSQYVPLKRRGSVATGHCPFHGPDKNPSFRVTITGKHAGTWNCWPCGGRPGDAQDFLAKIERITPFEALKRLAADAAIPMDAPSESPEQRKERREEKDICAWWYRAKWSKFRRALNSIMENGPPELHSREDTRAEYLGQVMRWIEREHATERGLAVFRQAPVIEGAYRRWKSRREEIKRMYAGCTVSDWLKSPEGPLHIAPKGEPKDADEFVIKYGAEAYRRAVDNAVWVPMLKDPGIMGKHD